MPVLDELASWYAAQCNGTWEHDYGISVKSTDNPGWWVTVDTRRTALEGRAFTPAAEGVDAGDFPLGPRWLVCRLRDGVWHGAGDESRLEEILSRFLAWTRSEG